MRTAFFGKTPDDNTPANSSEETVDVSVRKKSVFESQRTIYLLMLVPLAITAVISILLCLFPNTLNIYDLAQMAVKNIFGGM